MRISLIFSAILTWNTLHAVPVIAASPELPALGYKLKKGRLEVSPPKAHHFNTKAPAQVRIDGKDQSFQLKKDRLVSKIAGNSAAKEAEIRVFVCDDSNTYCLKKSQTVPLASSTGTGESPPVSSSK